MVKLNVDRGAPRAKLSMPLDWIAETAQFAEFSRMDGLPPGSLTRGNVLFSNHPADRGAYVVSMLLRDVTPHVDSPAVLSEQPRASVLRKAESLLGLLSALLPARVVNEELGDALEDIEARIARGRPRAEIRLKIYASVFWALWHTVLYAVKGITDALGRNGRGSDGS